MSEWQPRLTAPTDGVEIYVQAVWGTQPDDGRIIFEGVASYKEFTCESVIDPISGSTVFPKNTSMRWVRSDNGKCVPGRIVRWREPK